MTDGLDKRDARNNWRSGLIGNKARRWHIGVETLALP
jgi:hypothetical protein